jgi:hypothetical protein
VSFPALEEVWRSGHTPALATPILSQRTFVFFLIMKEKEMSSLEKTSRMRITVTSSLNDISSDQLKNKVAKFIVPEWEIFS